MSCRTVMENFAKETIIDNPEEIKNINEPWVGKEIAKKFDEMYRHEDFSKGVNE